MANHTHTCIGGCGGSIWCGARIERDDCGKRCSALPNEAIERRRLIDDADYQAAAQAISERDRLFTAIAEEESACVPNGDRYTCCYETLGRVRAALEGST